MIIVVACLDASESKYAAELVPHTFGLLDLERTSFYFSSAAVIVEELLLALKNHSRVWREAPLAVTVAIVATALEIASTTISVRVGFVGTRIVVLLELKAVGARGGVACCSVFVPLHRLVIVVFHEQVLLILVSAAPFFVRMTVI